MLLFIECPGLRYAIMVLTKPKKRFQLLKILMGLRGIQFGKEPKEKQKGLLLKHPSKVSPRRL